MNRKAVYSNSRKALYFSPLRNDNKPRFWVNLVTNEWRDYGDMKWKKGNVIQLVKAIIDSEGEDYLNPDIFRWLKSIVSSISITPVNVEEYSDDRKNLKLKKVTPVESEGLYIYALNRGISKAVVDQYFKEIHFIDKSTGKTHIALAIKNESKGYSVRNPTFKGSVQKRGVIVIKGTSQRKSGVHIFEEITDFASIVTQRGKAFEDDVIILTNLSLLEKGTSYIKNYKYRLCYTWMDNDTDGMRATESWRRYCRSEKKLTHVSMNELFAPYKDVNAHHMAKLGISF